jgi:orotidine-5'-phosphate decarboxylase
MTPVEAQTAGADILVIGRPIISHDTPQQAARDIADSLNAAAGLSA